MQWLKEKWLLLAAAILVAVVLYFSIYHPYRGPDTIADPIQSQLAQAESVVYQGRSGPVTIEFLAAYQITAAVKSKHNYATDYASQVSPTDLALAWGELNQEKIDSHIRYRQSGRWYYYQYDANLPVKQATIQEHSANVHLIPADDRIAAQIKKIRKNDTVELTGYLAAVHFDSGSWTSSLTRQDGGDGSCEILYVTKIGIR